VERFALASHLQKPLPPSAGSPAKRQAPRPFPARCQKSERRTEPWRLQGAPATRADDRVKTRSLNAWPAPCRIVRTGGFEPAAPAAVTVDEDTRTGQPPASILGSSERPMMPSCFAEMSRREFWLDPAEGLNLA